MQAFQENTGLFGKFLRTYSGGFVLAFHEIPAERLVEFVSCLRPVQVVPLSELVQRSKRGKPTSGLMAITVDDGVGENVRSLSKACLAEGWPVTFYIATQYLDTGEAMAFQWWRRLKPLLPRQRLTLKSGVLDLSQPGALEQLSRRMEGLWCSRRLEAYLPLIAELTEIASRGHGISREAIRPEAPITWAEVEKLSGDEIIQFESHGVSHAAMSALTDEELNYEMRHSQQVVAEHTGHPCRHIAYPFGGWRSIGQRAAAAAERFYDSAATMNPGHVDSANPWLLPRIPLYAKNSTLVARLKVVLNCHKIGGLASHASAVSPDRPLDDPQIVKPVDSG